MKIFLKTAIFLAIVLLPSICFARLGESLAASERRYGKAIREQVLKNGRVQRAYRVNRYKVWVEYEQDRTVALSYQLISGQPMSVKRLEELLRGNGSNPPSGSASGLTGVHTWYLAPPRSGAIEFIERGGGAAASYSLSGNVLTFRLR